MPFFIHPVAAEHHRLVTPMELFIDLVLVAAILHLGNLQAVDFVSKGAPVPGAPVDDTGAGKNGISSILYFAGLWLSWYQLCHFMSRYYAKDTITKTHFVMTGLWCLGMAAFTQGSFDSDSRHYFSFSYIACRLYFIFMHLLVGMTNKDLRKSSLGFVVVFAITSIIWLIALFVDYNVALAFWVVGYFLECVLTFFVETNAPPVPIELMAERHGELFMIAVGENIIQLVIGPITFTLNNIMACIFGFMLAFMLVLLYFECQPEDEHEHAYHRGGFAAFMFVYTHMLLLFFLMGVGVSVKLFLKIAGYYYTKPEYSWFFYVCLVSAVVLNNVVRLTHKGFRFGQAAHVHDKTQEKPHKTLVKRLLWVLRILLIGTYVIVPLLAKKIPPMESMGIYFGITALLVWIDNVQKILYPEVHLQLEHGGGGHGGGHGDAGGHGDGGHGGGHGGHYEKLPNHEEPDAHHMS